MAAARKVSQAASTAVSPLCLYEIGELGGGGGFPCAVDANDRNHRQPLDSRFKAGFVQPTNFSPLRARDRKNIQAGAALRFVTFLDRVNNLRSSSPCPDRRAISAASNSSSVAAVSFGDG